MSTPPGELHLTGGATTVVLRRAQIEAMGVEYDLAAFRAPFGAAWHQVGTGHPRPATIRVSGVLEGATSGDSDALLTAALEALPNVTALLVAAWSIPVAGVTGPVPASPTLRGWRITADLVATPTDWSAAP